MPEDKIVEMLREDIGEIKDSMKELHRQMTSIVAARTVTEGQCEERRNRCPRGGIPGWVATLVAFSGALLGYFLSTAKLVFGR